MPITHPGESILLPSQQHFFKRPKINFPASRDPVVPLNAVGLSISYGAIKIRMLITSLGGTNGMGIGMDFHKIDTAPFGSDITD